MMETPNMEDIKWVPNPWNSTTRSNFVVTSSSSAPKISNSTEDGNGHNQEIIEYDNGLILINDFLSNEGYQDLLDRIKDEFRIMEEGLSGNANKTANGDDKDKDNLGDSPPNINSPKSTNKPTPPPNPTTTSPSKPPSKPKSKAKARRLAIHYGPKYDYTTNHASPNPIPLPPYIQQLIEMITPHVGGVEMNQATIQYYPPGSGIPPHIDTHSCFDTHILSFSLGSTVNMSFVKANKGIAVKMFAPRRCVGGPTTSTNTGNGDATNGKDHPTPPSNAVNTDTGSSNEIPLLPNSLCIMSKEIRYAWTHGIKTRSTDPIKDPISGEIENVRRGDRYSITFRRVDFQGVCKCDYGVWCDSQQSKKED